MQPTWESLREAIRVREKLDRMTYCEHLAERHDQTTCPTMRAWFAQAYREVIGVHPQRRAALRAALELYADCSPAPLEQIVRDIESGRPGHNEHSIAA